MEHTFKCSKCETTRVIKSEKSRTPTGWKNRPDGLYCGECWSKRYVLRAIAMPVAEPLSGDWKEFDAACKEAWIQTTAAANWMTTELYVRDIRRKGEEKMPPMPKAYLYPEARERFPGLTPRTVAALEQMIQKKYRSKRVKVVWTATESLPNYRYPMPLPLPNQAWSATVATGDRPVWSGRIGDRRWEVRLRGGIRYKRQVAAFRQIVSGECIQGEAAVYRQADKTIVKMVGWFPRSEARAANGTLHVQTAADNLLVAVDSKGNRLWQINFDHLPRWVAEHREQLQRWSEDSKAEQRPVPTFQARRTAATEKFDDRMRSAVNEAAAHIANYARRRKYAEVVYNDHLRSFCPDFRWAALKERLAIKLDEYGIEFVSGDAIEQSP